MLTTDDPGSVATHASAVDGRLPRPASLVMLRGEGRVTVTRRGTTLVACRLFGVIETVHVEWLLAELERQLAGGATTVFVDASRLPTLGATARQALGAWSVQGPATLHAVHVLGVAPTLDEPLTMLGRALGERLHRHHRAESFHVALEAHGISAQ